MNEKDYLMTPVVPMSFEDWKGSVAPQFTEDTMKALKRLHDVDYEKEFEQMLRREYAEYKSNLNGNWLL